MLQARWPAILLLFAASVSPCFSQERLTLAAAIAEATDRNMGLLAEKANIAIAEARIIGARLRPNPVVSASADHLDALGTGFNENNGGGPSEYSLRVDMPIERGNKRALRVEVAQLGRTVAELQFQNALRSLTLDVANAFVDAQVARESLRLARENLEHFDSIVQVNQARLKAGDIAEVEMMRSTLAALAQRNVVRDAEARWRTGLIRLQTAMGRAQPAMAVDVEGDLRRDSDLAPRDEWRQSGLTLRPDLLALRKDSSRAGAEVRLQQSLAKVDPTVGAEYRRQQGVNGVSNSMGVFVEAPLPVFNRNQGEIERVRQELRQLELRIRQLEASIAGEVEMAYEQMQAAQSQLRSLEGDMLAKAQEVRRVTEFSYRRGYVSLLEMLDAQRAYNETLQAEIEARAAYARSLYALDSAAGRTVIK